MTYVQLQERRIVAWTEAQENPNPDIWEAYDLPTERRADFGDWLLVDGELVHDPVEPDPADVREWEIQEAMQELPETVEGLMEVAGMAAANEATLEEVIDAVMELAALIGGE